MQRIMKQILQSVLLFSVCSLILSCGGTKTETPKADAPKTDTPAEVKWPTGDVTILVPADVGAPLDLATRVMKDYLQEKTGVNIIIENEPLERRFRQEVSAMGYSQQNTLGLVATRAAYAHGEEWYQGMLSYIRGNLDYTERFVKDNIKGVRLIRPEGTYLAWLDCRELHLTADELDDLFLNKAKIFLDSGRIFGKDGEGYQRINLACTRATLTEALTRLQRAVEELH